MATKRHWDPWKSFDVAPEEMRAVQERAKTRQFMKAEFQKKITNPYRGQNGFVMDPAIQRFMAMRSSQYEYFKATPKTVWSGFILLVLPVSILSYFTIKDRKEKEKKYRAGEIAYKDRTWKLVY